MSETLTPPSFQNRVLPWMLECFGPTIPYDKLERGDRLLEEVLELLQSGNYPKQRIAALVEYVYGRDVGEPKQEVGGVMVTLAAYCLAHEVDMHEAAETELARIWTKVEQIRAKQASKPTGSALPVAVDSGPSQQELAEIGQSVMNWIDELTQQEGPLEDWTPAESPAEIIPDLYNMLEESLACHRQACGETQRLADKMLELAEAIETELEIIGADDPFSLAALRKAVKIAKDAKTGKPIVSLPAGFCWINQSITVTGGDYAYEGQLLCSFPKDQEDGAIRYIVRDQNRRLFIHNAQQCGLEDTI
ncbi:hypothetical protein [Rhizobium leguminosarum]|uniref:hypothetical protein n=1 Tax=Rhizobium leguminosarum TaxID=384 RepID=UPI001FE00EEA|nr:hypothetical protein [Rhizobium leguminosarum]